MRHAVLAEHKQRRAGKVLAVLPIRYPKELLTALNILALEVWGPPGAPQSAEVGRIQTYVCPVVRNAMAFLAGGKADAVDGVLFPHTCDSIQGLATVLPDLGKFAKPVFHFIHPKGERRESTRRYVKREVQSLAESLSAFAETPLTEEALREAISLHRQIDRLKHTLLERRAYLDVTDGEFYRVLRRGEFLWPEDHLKELQQVESKLREEPVQQGVPLMVCGIVPEPMGFLSALNEGGAYVVADDYAAVGRRVIPGEIPDSADPMDVLTELYFRQPPCSTQALLFSVRRRHLDTLLSRSKAQGLVVHGVTFCEPELFDLPHLRAWAEAKGLPMLTMNSELEAELSGQSLTRLEAFVEMAAQKGGLQ